jgi:hypothetical protein
MIGALEVPEPEILDPQFRFDQGVTRPEFTFQPLADLPWAFDAQL